MIKHRKQEHILGCGLACVAMAADVSYASVRFEYDEIFGEPDWVYSKNRKRYLLDYGTSAGDLRTLLKCYGLKSSSRLNTFGSWDKLPQISILSVYHKQVADACSWHWVIFDQNQDIILDPWPHSKKRPMIRTDYKRLRPKYYMGVW